jgi:hypothetical protein
VVEALPAAMRKQTQNTKMLKPCAWKLVTTDATQVITEDHQEQSENKLQNAKKKKEYGNFQWKMSNPSSMHDMNSTKPGKMASMKQEEGRMN